MEIILKAVSKKIGYTQVLDNINCLFLGGKIYGIVGYNGSGKTMLLRAICGLIFPDSGKVIIDGKQLSLQVERLILTESDCIGTYPFRPHSALLLKSRNFSVT